MINAFLSELIKLRRKAMGWLLVLMAGTGALISGFTVLTASNDVTNASSAPGPPSVSRASLEAATALSDILGGITQLLGVVALAAAATIVSTEYANSTWRNLLVRQPRRMRLLTGKIGAIVAFVTVGVVLAIAVAVPCSLLFGSMKNIDTSTWLSGAGWSALAGTSLNLVLSCLGFAALGVLAAILLRSPAAAVGAGLAYAIPGEGLVAQAASKVGRWLPGQVFNAVASGGTTDSAYRTVIVLGTVYLAAALGTAVMLFNRRELAS
jgi:ABC-2 type transport system permease protein